MVISSVAVKWLQQVCVCALRHFSPCPPRPPSPGLTRLMYKVCMKADLCNNVAEIGRRVKMSESVWLDCKLVFGKASASCEL